MSVSAKLKKEHDDFFDKHKNQVYIFKLSSGEEIAGRIDYDFKKGELSLTKWVLEGNAIRLLDPMVIKQFRNHLDGVTVSLSRWNTFAWSKDNYGVTLILPNIIGINKPRDSFIRYYTSILYNHINSWDDKTDEFINRYAEYGMVDLNKGDNDIDKDISEEINQQPDHVLSDDQMNMLLSSMGKPKANNSVN